MSIQSGWNSLLGMYGGIGALTSSAKQQEYQSVLDAKKMSDEELKQGTEEWESIKKGLPENTPIEEIQKLGGELAEVRRNEFRNKVYYEGMPKRMRKMFDKGGDVSVISTLENLGDRSVFMRNVLDVQNKYGGVNRSPEEVARSIASASQAAQVADAAPRNTMQGAMDAVRASQVELPDEEIVNPIRLGIGGGN